MLIPMHTPDTLPMLDEVALVAYADPLHVRAAGADGPLQPSPRPQMIAAVAPLPEISAPEYSLPAADGSETRLRIKRGICAAMVAIPLSLYLYFSLIGSTYRVEPPQSGKTADAQASKRKRTIAHDALTRGPLGHSS